MIVFYDLSTLECILSTPGLYLNSWSVPELTVPELTKTQFFVNIWHRTAPTSKLYPNHPYDQQNKHAGEKINSFKEIYDWEICVPELTVNKNTLGLLSHKRTFNKKFRKYPNRISTPSDNFYYSCNSHII